MPQFFFRSRRRRVLAGVCAQFAQLWGLPLFGVRVATVIAACIAPGMIILVYLWLWLAVPLGRSPETE